MYDRSTRWATMREIHGEEAGAGCGDRAGPMAVLATETTPRSVEEALRWQLDRIGSTAWEGWALRFQRLAFGYVGESGWRHSADGYAWLREHDLVSAGAAPRGALVWFRVDTVITVRAALGDARVLGPGVRGRVGIVDQGAVGDRMGWSPATFPFAH